MAEKDSSEFSVREKTASGKCFEELDCAEACRSPIGEIGRGTGSKNKNSFLCEARGCSGGIDVCSPPEENLSSRDVPSEDLKENELGMKIGEISINMSEYRENQTEENSKGENMDVTERANPKFESANQFSRDSVKENTGGIEDSNISVVGISSVNDRSRAENSNDLCSLLTEDTVSPCELIASHFENNVNQSDRPGTQERESEENIVANKRTEYKIGSRAENSNDLRSLRTEDTTSPCEWIASHSCEIQNLNQSDRPEIKKRVSEENIVSNKRTQYKIGMEKGPRQKSALGKYGLENIQWRERPPKRSKRSLPSRIESLKKGKKGKSGFSIIDDCVSSSSSEASSKHPKTKQLGTRSKPKEFRLKKRFRERKACVLNNTEEQDRNVNCLVKGCFVFLMSMVCFWFWISNDPGILLRQCKPSPGINKFMSYMLIDGFEDKQWADVVRLYSVASMCEIPYSQKTTRSRLQSSITVSNAWITYVLADAYEDQRLKESAEAFMKANYNETLNSKTWKEKMHSMMTAITDNFIADYKSSHFLGKE